MMEFIEGNHYQMGVFDDNFIDGFFDCSFINDVPVNSPAFSFVQSSSVDIDFSQTGGVRQEQESEKICPTKSIDIDFSQTGSVLEDKEFGKEYPSKRGRGDACYKPKTKACRERERREKLNESFFGLSSVIEPGRVARTDKFAILNDAIKVLNQLRSEAEEYKQENKRLLEEIETLKAEKNELREEKLALKAEKEKMEHQLTAVPVPSPGLVPSHPAAYAGANKMSMYSCYGMFPVWHYLPPSIRDTSRDHELRPPAA